MVLDRVFWLLWLAFPVYLWMSVADVLGQADYLAALAPEQAHCIRDLPLVTSFGLTGQVVYWSSFGIYFAVFGSVLALAHRVVRSCAKGNLFVEPLISALRMIGVVIAAYPVLDLVIYNVTASIYVATGDVTKFLPDYRLDVSVMGVGLLLLTIAIAMQAALQLEEDAKLTI